MNRYYYFFSLLFLFGCQGEPIHPQLNPRSQSASTVSTADPCMNISSSKVQILFANCGNSVRYEMIDKKFIYNPSFIASDADVIGDQVLQDRITIVPKGDSCKVTVRNVANGSVTTLKEITYRVFDPPKPTIELWVDGILYNGMSPISKKSVLTLKVVPNSDFQATFPKDSRYMIGSVHLLSQRSLGDPTKIGVESGAGKMANNGITLDFIDELKSDVPGTKCYLQIDDLNRINFQNKPIMENLSERELMIGFTVK